MEVQWFPPIWSYVHWYYEWIIDEFLSLNITKTLAWMGTIENEIKFKSTQYCNVKNQNRLCEFKSLLNEINIVNNLLTQNPQSQQYHEKHKFLQQRYDILAFHKRRGAQIRSRIKSIEDVEINTNHFLGLKNQGGGK